MALSTQTLRTSNTMYAIPPPPPPPPPPNTQAGRLTISRPVGYGNQTFSSTQLQHPYFGGASYSSMMLSCQPPLSSLSQTGLPSLLPPSSLPESPVQPSSDGVLPRKQSVSSHGSPIAPSSPGMEEQEAGDQYKVYNNYRSTVSSSLNSFGVGSPFSSFPSTHQPSTLPMPCGMGMGYPTPPSTMCPPSMYTSQDMCPSGTSSLSLPVWNYPTLPSMGIPATPISKLSLDSPRYKLTPERAVPLVKWFEDHKEHPYPTRHEKVLLCQTTQLTYTQVSTWFANARRRMKKANSEEDENRSNHSSSDDCASLNSLDSPTRPS